MFDLILANIQVFILQAMSWHRVHLSSKQAIWSEQPELFVVVFLVLNFFTEIRKTTYGYPLHFTNLISDVSAVLVHTSCRGHQSQFVYNLTLPPVVATLTVSVQLNCTSCYGLFYLLDIEWSLKVLIHLPVWIRWKPLLH